jgi:serine/threonine protein kinase
MHTTDQLNTSLAGTYAIEREIGRGGMATVYVAHDVKHDRRVAVKVLHPDLAATLGAERFLAEIKTTANLQHPHILPLHDSGVADGFLFYVMPFVEGESLRDRLNREKQLPIDDAIRISQQVASALDYAHRHRVVHRDIKPENILLHEGSALVADFGIALAVQSAGGERMTQTGLSLGTPHYMSPEQAMGDKNVDARSDIYSLAAMTYEMLAGEPPFTGATVQAIVAKVIAAEPQPVTMTRRNVSPATAAAVHRGLEKVPADRFATAADFGAALTRSDISANGNTSTGPRASASRLRGVRPALVVAVAAVVAAAFVAGRLTKRGAQGLGEPIMATLVPDEGDRWQTNGTQFSLSPDGRRLVVSSRDSLLVRSLDSLTGVPLRNTKGARQVFWSPDGRSVGFFADQQLKTIDVATGAVRGLCPAARTGGATWGADGTILFSAGSMYRVNAAGGPCEKLNTRLPPNAVNGRPYFFPDSKHFLLTTDLAAYLGEIGSDSLVFLTALPRMRAVFAPPYYLMYEPEGSPTGSIFARRIDVARRALVGNPTKVVDEVPHNSGNTSLSASLNGTIVARVRPSRSVTFVAAFTRGGAAVAADTTRVEKGFGPFRLAHDGRRLVTGGFQVDVLDLERHVATPLIASTAKGTLFQFEQWSPRDTAIAYIERDSTNQRLKVIDVSTGTTRVVTDKFPAGRAVALEDWSADGRYLAYTLSGGGDTTQADGWIYDLSENQSRRMLDVAPDTGSFRISPNGRSVAYALRDGVFLRSFPGAGTPIRVSPASGHLPRWRADAHELFYGDTSGAIMAVPVRDDGTLAGPAQVAVAATQIRAAVATLRGAIFDFEPSPDGKRFYVRHSVNTERATLTLLTNWWKFAGVPDR